MQPSFKIVFGVEWDQLPVVFKKRYSNRAFSNDICSVEGLMDINYAWLMSFFLFFFRWFHLLVPYKGTNISTKVDFRSVPTSDVVHLDRQFFVGNSPYTFNSYMQPINYQSVIEYMALGIGWETHYFYDGKKVVMQHKRYLIRLFGLNITLPLELILGKGYAEEVSIDDNSYRVTMTISHFLWGEMYRYTGDFTFTRLPHE